MKGTRQGKIGENKPGQKPGLILRDKLEEKLGKYSENIREKKAKHEVNRLRKSRKNKSQKRSSKMVGKILVTADNSETGED